MKKNKDLLYVFIGVAIIIAIGLIVRNTSSTSLNMMIVELNKSLPQKGYEGYDYFTLEKCKLVGNNVVWECTLDETFFYPDRESAMPSAINNGVLSQGSSRDDYLDIDHDFSNNVLKKFHKCTLLYNNLIAIENNDDPFYREMKKQGCSQIFRTHSPYSNRTIEVKITAEEQKNIEVYCKQRPKEALEEFVSLYIQRQNLMLSNASDEEGIVMNMVDDGSDLVFRFVFDTIYSAEDNEPIENLRGNIDEIEDAVKKDVESLSVFFNVKRICEKTGRGYVVRYVDGYITDSLDLKIY